MFVNPFLSMYSKNNLVTSLSSFLMAPLAGARSDRTLLSSRALSPTFGIPSFSASPSSSPGGGWLQSFTCTGSCSGASAMM